MYLGQTKVQLNGILPEGYAIIG